MAINENIRLFVWGNSGLNDEFIVSALRDRYLKEKYGLGDSFEYRKIQCWEYFDYESKRKANFERVKNGNRNHGLRR